MKIKKWLFYLVYAVVLIVYAVFGYNLANHLKGQGIMNADFIMSFVPELLFFVIFGVLLGITNFLSEIKKEGKWKLNFPRLTFIGIPTLVLSLYMMVYFLFPITLPLFFLHIFYPFIFQIIFGYTLITSFYKEKSTK